MCDSIEKSVLAEAHRLGLEDVQVGRTRRHPHLRASLPVPGAPSISYAFPGTPSDWRSKQNAGHQLRRIVRRAFEHRGPAAPASPRKQGPRPLKRKPKGKPQQTMLPLARPVLEPRSCTETTASPWGKLAGLREALVAAERAAGEEPDPKHNLLYAGAAARARRNGQ